MAFDSNFYHKAARDTDRFLTLLDGVVALRDLVKDVAAIVQLGEEAQSALKVTKEALVAAQRQVALAKSEADQTRVRTAAEADHADAIFTGKATELAGKVKAFEDGKLAYEQALAVRTDAVRERESNAKALEDAVVERERAVLVREDAVTQREAEVAARAAKMKEALS